MGEIQSSINSIIGNIGKATAMVKGFKALTEKGEGGGTSSVYKGKSPQALAAAAANESADNEMEAKQIQKEQLKKLVESYNRGEFQYLPINIQQNIAKRVSEVENGGNL